VHFSRVFVCYFGFPGSLRVAWGLGISVLYRVAVVRVITRTPLEMQRKDIATLKRKRR
jgi:hypothetical protein